MKMKEFMNQKANDMSATELINALNHKIKEEKNQKPKLETQRWDGITKYCKFIPTIDCEGYYFLDVVHNEESIGLLNILGFGCKINLNPHGRKNYKVEYDREHFKILKRGGLRKN